MSFAHQLVIPGVLREKVELSSIGAQPGTLMIFTVFPTPLVALPEVQYQLALQAFPEVSADWCRSPITRSMNCAEKKIVTDSSIVNGGCLEPQLALTGYLGSQANSSGLARLSYGFDLPLLLSGTGTVVFSDVFDNAFGIDPTFVDLEDPPPGFPNPAPDGLEINRLPERFYPYEAVISLEGNSPGNFFVIQTNAEGEIIERARKSVV